MKTHTDQGVDWMENWIRLEMKMMMKMIIITAVELCVCVYVCACVSEVVVGFCRRLSVVRH